jgi:cell division protein FtsB
MGLLHNPMKIFIICLCFAVVSLLLNGGVFQLYKLHRDYDILKDQIVAAKVHISGLNKQLKMAKDPSFIEHQALDNYDLVDENDLVFVFSEE